MNLLLFRYKELDSGKAFSAVVRLAAWPLHSEMLWYVYHKAVILYVVWLCRLHAEINLASQGRNYKELESGNRGIV